MLGVLKLIPYYGKPQPGEEEFLIKGKPKAVLILPVEVT